MSRFIETLKLQNGSLFRMANHQKRVERTFIVNFPGIAPFSLDEIIKTEKLPENGTYKIRIIYSEKAEKIEIQPYTLKSIQQLKLVHIQAGSSFFKSEMRDTIRLALEQKGNCDDIIMVNNGLLTDTSYANISLFDGSTWVTPKKPYIYGTNRDYLLDMGLIAEQEISANDIFSFQKIRIFNAMIEFGELEIDINEQSIRI